MNTQGIKRTQYTNQIRHRWLSIALLLPLLALVACQGEALPTEEELSKSNFLSDNSFIPKVVDIAVYDICKRTRSQGFICDPAFVNDFPEKGQTTISSAIRVMVTMDKPVFLDEGSQVDIGLNNADFFEPSGVLQPLLAPDLEGEEYSEPDVADPETLGSQQYTFFTTQHTIGHVLPRSDGTFTVTIPADLVYDVNVNGKKIYNRQAEASFEYDTTEPIPILKLVDERNIISRLNRMSASAKNFQHVVLEIEWGEPVTPAGEVIDLLIKKSDTLSISCASNCVSGKTVKGEYIYFGNAGSARTFDKIEENSLDESYKYYIKLSESDVSRDVLAALQDGTVLDFKLSEDIVKDAAGNLNKESISYSISIDASQPKINSLSASTIGGLSIGAGATLLGVGDILRFEVELSEPVILSNPDNIVTKFSIGEDLVTAEINFVNLKPAGGESSLWQMEYVIEEGYGSNDIVGFDHSDDSWRSDIDLTYYLESDDVSDTVGNLLDESNLLDRTFDVAISPDLIDLHVDGNRPAIDTSFIEEYSLLISGDPSTGTPANIIANGKKLAIAIPFSESVRDNTGTELDFQDDGAWTNTTLQIQTYADALGSRLLSSVDLAYDPSLTDIAQTNGNFSDHLNTIVYSTIINSSYKRSESLRVISLNGEPNGVIPENLLDKAGNLFDPDQATAGGFIIQELIDIRVDGGPFTIASIFPMYQDDKGEIVEVPLTAAEHEYKLGDAFYIGMLLSRELSGSIDASPSLTIRLDDATGDAADVSSSHVEFAKDSTGGADQRDFLIFSYENLSTSAPSIFYDDVNGIEIIRLDDPSSILLDENSTPLNRAITNSIVRGGSGELEQPRIDTDAPKCFSSYLTDRPTGNKRTAPYTVTPNNPLYLAIECDQAIFFSAPSEGSLDTPYIYGTFLSTNTGVLFQYSSLANANKRIMYELPILTGYNPNGSNIQVGESYALSIRKFYNTTDATSDEFDFFADAVGNTARLTITSEYFADTPVHNPNTDTSSLSGDDIIMDSAAFPVAVRYLLPQAVYTDDNDVSYISANTNSNTLTIEVDYGLFDADDNPVLSDLSTDGDEDVSINLYYKDGTPLGMAEMIGLGDNPYTLVYSIEFVDYANTNNNNFIDAIAINYEVSSAGDTFLPYTIESLESYLPTGNIDTSSTTSSMRPVSGRFLAKTSGIGDIPQIKLNRTRPQLITAESGRYPIEVWRVSGNNVAELNVTRNPNPLYYGEIYFALVFDKDVSEDSFVDTQLNVVATTDGGSVSIESDDINWISRADFESKYNNANTAVGGKRKVFYQFNYGDSRYAGSGFHFPSPGSLLTILADRPQDIYGNEIKENFDATITSLADGYPVTLDAKADIDKVSFDKDFYKFGDTIEVRVETLGRIDWSSLAPTEFLAVEARITRDEYLSSTVSSPLYLYHTAIRDEAPGTTDYHQTGSTVIVFEGTIDNTADHQFNDDVTDDADYGISFSGGVRKCPTSTDSTRCSIYSPQILDSSGASLRQAGLGVAEVNGVATQAGVNSFLPRFVLDGNDVSTLITFRYEQSGESGVEKKITAGSPTLKAGDTIIFDLPVTMQNQAKYTGASANNSLNDSNSGNASQLHFEVYNLVDEGLASRVATYDSIGGANTDTMRFTYVIQAGDYIGMPNGNNQITLRGGGDVSDDLLIARFHLESLIRGGDTKSILSRYTDTFFGNTLISLIYDSTGSVRAAQEIDYSGDIRIDTRPSIESIEPIIARGTYSDSTEIQFVVAMSEAVTITSEPSFVVRIGSADRTQDAIYSEPDTTRDTHPVFTFDPIDGSSGEVSILDYSADGSSAYIRDKASNEVHINADISTISTALGITIDSVNPKITNVTLASATGVYSPSSANSQLQITFDLDKRVTISGSSSTNRPQFEITVDNKDGTTSDYALVYSGGDLSDVAQITFAIDVSDITGEVQDYNGIEFKATSFDVGSTGLTIGDSAGNPLLNSALNDASADSWLGTFDIFIDTSVPKIAEIIEVRGGSVGAPADYSADNNMVFLVTFDETVVLRMQFLGDMEWM